LLGLDTGADSPVCTGNRPRELVARIKAVLRRARPAGESVRVLDVDEHARTVRVRAQALDLTRTEFDLLATMARRPGTIYTRAQLLDVVDRDSLDVNERAVDTHIKNLRRKLAQLAPDLTIIHSVYGLGYRVEPSENR
jgi:two-component system response regulator BaeR